ncbi:MAG: hypothetical protein JWM98_1350 [Thermoleophilia bacterium]|nr:hypothetical protein [Thermoleophilia bacterium]
MNRSIAALVACAGLLVLASPAMADDSTTTSGDTTAASSTSADTSTTSTTPVTQTPATTTSTPATETPATTTTTTPETPATTTTTNTVPATTTTTVPTTTATTTVPTTTETTIPDVAALDTDCAVDCIPNTGTDCLGTACASGAGTVGGRTAVLGAGRSLPFTGIGDVLAPLLLALVAVLGGVVAWRWAQLREAVAQAATRARPMPARSSHNSGYDGAIRTLAIEDRARRVFTPRVA